jgi:APA family basic amino acid/polyamine antiporter
VHPRFQTPGPSLVVQGLWSIALVFSGTFDTLTDTLIFVSWIFYAAGAFGLFVLRVKMPDAPRPYKVPGYPWVPALFVVFAILFLIMTICNDVIGYRAGIAAGRPVILNFAFGAFLVLLGAPLYWYYTRRD